MSAVPALSPEDRFMRKADGNVHTYLRTDPDGKIVLRTQFGGTEFVRPEELAAFYQPLQWTVPAGPNAGRRVELGSRWQKNGELFTVTRIDAPQTDRVILRGDRGQVIGVEPIAELFGYYRPADAEAEARFRHVKQEEPK